MLRRMIRRYTRAEYIERARRLLAARPGMTMSTDVIIGFSGETDDDFEQTLSLVREIGFTSLFGFEYSPRPDTPALKLRLRDDVPVSEKAGRLQALQAMQARISHERLERHVGRTVEVLVEGAASRGEGRLCGRAPGNAMINFAADEGAASLAGALVRVEITARRANTLNGRLVDVAERAPLVTPPPAVGPRRLPVLA